MTVEPKSHGQKTTGSLSKLYEPVTDEPASVHLGDLLGPVLKSAARRDLADHSLEAREAAKHTMSPDDIEKVLRTFAANIGENPNAVAKEFRANGTLARTFGNVLGVFLEPRNSRGAPDRQMSRHHHELVRRLKNEGLKGTALEAAITDRISRRADGAKTTPKTVLRAYRAEERALKRRHNELVDKFFEVISGN